MYHVTRIGLFPEGSGLCSAPTFSWLNDESSPTGVPLLSIDFHDGVGADVAILKQINPIPRRPNEKEEDIDRCIFDGFLKNEDKVYVTLTGGCPFEDTFQVTQSSALC